jgi:hypothetical protein
VDPERAATAQRGQATVEWLSVVLLVGLLLMAVLAATAARMPATGLVRGIVARLLCAADLSGACSENSELVVAYGPELAAVVSERAPRIVYEEGMSALPVDFRACRASRCGNGARSGAVWTSDSGERAVAFVHVVDCRAPAADAARDHDCSGARAGNVYVQYWLYYADSTSLRALPGDVGFHEDDWEGYQVRVGPAGADARATSHHGYAYRGGPVNWLSDAGVVSKSAWGRATGRLYVSGGSHAGHVYEPRRLAPPRGVEGAATVGALSVWPAARSPRVRSTGRRAPSRWTPTSHLALIPIETLPRSVRRTRFAITPPWRKPVYLDPEDSGT